jgi:polyphosphate kinase
VRSIVDRFLEHHRIYYFENAAQQEVYLGSADWMPRNFFRRIETVFPILDGNLRERIIAELIAIPLADNQRARILSADGTYHLKHKRTGKLHRSQLEFIALAGNSIARKPKTRLTAAGFPEVKLKKRPF